MAIAAGPAGGPSGTSAGRAAAEVVAAPALAEGVEVMVSVAGSPVLAAAAVGAAPPVALSTPCDCPTFSESSAGLKTGAAPCRVGSGFDSGSGAAAAGAGSGAG